MKQRPQLIVPIRDRRERKRYLTTKNVLGVSLAAVAIFATVTIASEMRKDDKDNYGRLFGKQVSQPELAKPVYDVVKELPVNDQTASDPMLVSSGAREQILLDQTTTNPTTTMVAEPPVAIASTTGTLAPGAGVAITGGPEGVTITQGQTKRPTLAGGIFKQK